MAQEFSAPTGIFGSLRHLGATFLQLVNTRFELLALEWREERERAVSLLVWSAVFVALAFMAMIAATFLLVVAFQEQALWVLLGFAVFYFCGALTALMIIVRRMKAPLFPETINQVKKDREWLLGSRS